ncbi:hypothetical protein O3G_MSEX000080, partial [Manduca sexta]
PSVLEIINNLLTNLRTSVARDSEKETDEKLYQEALINALGEFADHLPDFQKIDIMMFIVNKIPNTQRGGKPTRADTMLQSILLKSLLKVGATYRTVELSKAFPGAFLEALVRAGAAPAGARVLLQRVLHTLLDRRHNAPRLAQPTVDYAELGLTVEKCSRQDLESNTLENIEAIYTTVALLCIEVCCEETVADILQLVLAIQQSGLSNPVLSVSQQCQLQAISIALASLVPHVMTLPRLTDYLNKIVEARREECPHLLPPLQESYDHLSPSKMPSKVPYLMIDQMAVGECMVAAGVEAARVCAPAHYAAPGAAAALQRHSWVEAGAAAGRESLADIAPGGAELDSAGSSPAPRRQAQYDDLDEEYRMFIEKYNHNHRPSMQNFGAYVTCTNKRDS